MDIMPILQIRKQFFLQVMWIISYSQAAVVPVLDGTELL